jgi:tRNA-splicing ligase RtcB
MWAVHFVREGGNMQIINADKPIKIWNNDVEDEAINQLINLAKLPFIHNHIAVMPDVHAGKGSTIGTVIATKGAIIPAAVGVDIGCGMTAVKLPFKIDMFDGKLSELRNQIERSVPVGFNANKEISQNVETKIKLLGDLYCFDMIAKEIKRSYYQCGSLGGGNHFIEICTDTDGTAWVMLHSGSRNIGKTIADYHINNAKSLMKKYFINLPDPELAYLAQNTIEFDAYIHDMNWAQQYAFYNRDEMMERILKQISYLVYGKDYTNANNHNDLAVLKVSCHHNYTTIENHFGNNIFITRKGAVSARNGELGIIPGSMGAKSFIVRGLGNPESFYSCSHGAGRKMSRTKARAIFTQEDLINQTNGIECRKDNAVIDEIPGAYKDIDIVMNNQADLVSIEYTLKQLICIKG